MDESESQTAQLDAIARLDRLFGRNGMEYWLFGGWAVDFHIGAVTRHHADIDVAVVADDAARITALLESDGWTHRRELDGDGYSSYEAPGTTLEVALLARDEHGRFYTPLTGGRAEWPVGAFGADVATLRGVRARVISRQAVIAEKSGLHDDPAIAAKDRADLARLMDCGTASPLRSAD